MVVVTGAAGHIGANLVRALLAHGRAVRALVRRDTRAVDGLPVDLQPVDLHDADALDRALADAEAVYHCAGRISITGDPTGEVWRTNVDGARSVGQAARRAGIRMVHFSSCHAWDMDRPHVDEQSPKAGPHHPAYDRSKAAADAALLELAREGLDVVLLAPAAVLGPVDHRPSRTGQALLDLQRGRLPAVVPGGFDWVDVRDVAETALRAERLGGSGESYLLGGHWCSLSELVALAAPLCGRRPPRLVVPLALAHLAAPVVELQARLRGHEPVFTAEGLRAMSAPPRSIDDAKARRVLGHAPRPLEQTLADFYDSARELGP